MTGRQILEGLLDELPEPEPVVPVAFVQDEVLPHALALVEPAAFLLACVESAWGPWGRRN